ncbi:MAG: AAA family ATPase, partial [Anaerolinea sp.]|nr:AAA family ATPase [Anaerolinea sp.]
MELLNNRYQLHEVLGEGGMGIVYRAHDRLTGRHVALKRVYASVDSLVFNSRSSDMDIRLALAHEFQALASLRHPNIISVLDYGFSADHIPYFTMELLDNSRTLLRAGAHQSTSAKVMLLVQVLRALVYIHRQNILHRDLKPGNVLVVKDPTTQVDIVKVLDFGLSVDAGEARGTLGTLPYMAPEIILSQVQGFAYGAEVDLYAVGVLAYQLFVGRYPFHIEDIEMLLHEILDSLPDFSSVDLPPTLQATIARLLAKNPADRYHDANQVIYDLCAAVNLPIIDDDRATRESILQSAKFVGRSGDLQKLEAALELAMSGKGGAWLVGGESGVGKSRLLDELRTRAMVKGVSVLRGQGVESGGLPYQLWREPLRQLLLSVVPDDLEASVIKPLVPDIADLLNRPIADAHAVNAETQQSRLFSTIIALFRRQTEPTLLLLEDLQWAEESLAALKALLAGCTDSPLLIVASYRHDERPDLPHELKNAQIILLDRFNVDGISALTTSMLGDVGRRTEVVRLLERETEGNVFFLIEVMRALAEEAGSLARIGQTTLPNRVLAGGIQSIVRRRLNRVPAWGQPLLKRAAVAGRMLDLRLLDMVVQTGGYLDSKSLNDWLTDCANAAVLEFRDGTWRFTHDKLREALVEQLDFERSSLHREIATHLERLNGDEISRTAYAETLLDHWRRAGEPEKELHYVLLAAPQAIRFSGNYRAAQDWLEHALTLIDAGKIADADHQQMKLLKLLGEACSRLAQYPEAMEHYRQSMALAEKIDDRQMVISNLTGLAEVAIYHTSLPQAQSRAQTALGISREIHDQVGIAKSLQLLGQIDMFRGNLVDAKAQFDESLSIFRDLGFEPEVGAQLNYLGTIASIQG